MIRKQLDVHAVPYLHHGVARECTKLQAKDLLASLKGELAEWFRESPKPVKVRATLV